MSENIKAGWYNAIATGNVQVGYTAKGTEQLAVELQLLDEQDKGPLVWSILYFSDGARPFSFDKLRAIGWDGAGLIDKAIAGKRARLEVKYELYDGKTTMKVDIYAGNGGGKFEFQKQMEPGQRQGFLAAIGQAMQSSAPKPATPGADNGYPQAWDQSAPKPGGFTLGKG